jgi:hypothetical protein
MENIFRLVGFVPNEFWNDPARDKPKGRLGRPITDKAQLIDPLYNLLSEVEQPNTMKLYLKEWRSGAEMRFKLPYYPETKKDVQSFYYA